MFLSPHNRPPHPRAQVAFAEYPDWADWAAVFGGDRSGRPIFVRAGGIVTDPAPSCGGNSTSPEQERCYSRQPVPCTSAEATAASYSFDGRGWYRDVWGEQNAGSSASDSACQARKGDHDEWCGNNSSEWFFGAMGREIGGCGKSCMFCMMASNGFGCGSSAAGNEDDIMAGVGGHPTACDKSEASGRNRCSVSAEGAHPDNRVLVWARVALEAKLWLSGVELRRGAPPGSASASSMPRPKDSGAIRIWGGQVDCPGSTLSDSFALGGGAITFAGGNVDCPSFSAEEWADVTMADPVFRTDQNRTDTSCAAACENEDKCIRYEWAAPTKQCSLHEPGGCACGDSTRIWRGELAGGLKQCQELCWTMDYGGVSAVVPSHWCSTDCTYRGLWRGNPTNVSVAILCKSQEHRAFLSLSIASPPASAGGDRACSGGKCSWSTPSAEPKTLTCVDGTWSRNHSNASEILYKS